MVKALSCQHSVGSFPIICLLSPAFAASDKLCEEQRGPGCGNRTGQQRCLCPKMEKPVPVICRLCLWCFSRLLLLKLAVLSKTTKPTKQETSSMTGGSHIWLSQPACVNKLEQRGENYSRSLLTALLKRAMQHLRTVDQTPECASDVFWLRWCHFKAWPDSCSHTSVCVAPSSFQPVWNPTTPTNAPLCVRFGSFILVSYQIWGFVLPDSGNTRWISTRISTLAYPRGASDALRCKQVRLKVLFSGHGHRLVYLKFISKEESFDFTKHF